MLATRRTFENSVALLSVIEKMYKKIWAACVFPYPFQKEKVEHVCYLHDVR